MAEEFDVVVIGSGPGGYVAAIRAAQLGLKTACVERSHVLGGTCLNVGCIPSKALLHSTELLYKFSKEAKELGIEVQGISVNFKQMMDRKQSIVSGFNEGIAALFKKNKIVRFIGHGRLLTSNSIEVKSGPSTQQVSARHIILATGSESIALPFLPFDERRIVSSTGALSLEKIPKKLVVVGAGVIGVELGSVYSRLGTEVVFVEFLDRICSTLDESLTKALTESLTHQGMAFNLSSRVTGADLTNGTISLQVVNSNQSQSTISGDVVLISIGRKPVTGNLGLQDVGIEPTPKGMIPIDGQFRTKIPNIFAIGDIVDGPMLAHKASEEGVAVAEIIAGHSPYINYLTVPNVVYTNPEVASVGLTEKDANNLGLKVKTGMFPFKTNSRAKCTGEEEGFVKIVADEQTDRIVGVHIIGAHASELIAEGVLAIQKGATAEEIGSLCHAHPTLSEAFKEAALSVHKRPIHR